MYAQKHPEFSTVFVVCCHVHVIRCKNLPIATQRLFFHDSASMRCANLLSASYTELKDGLGLQAEAVVDLGTFCAFALTGKTRNVSYNCNIYNRFYWYTYRFDARFTAFTRKKSTKHFSHSRTLFTFLHMCNN